MNQRSITRIAESCGSLGGFFLRAWFVKILWNAILIKLFLFAQISYWEAAGLVFLVSCILHQSTPMHILDRLDRLVWKKEP